MSIEENWNRLYLFYKNLDFNKGKEIYSDTLKEYEYSDEDIQAYLEKLLSIEMIFNPVTHKEIDKIESQLSVTLPNSFKESLQINAFNILGDSYEYNWLGGWNRFLSVEDMIEFSLENREYLDFECFDNRIGLDDRYSRWEKEWVIIFEWNMNYLAVLNLTKESPNYGEVLCVEVEGGTITQWAKSYEIWLEMAVDEVLRYGELRLKTIEGLLGIK